MVPIGYVVSNDTGEQAHCAANAWSVHAAYVMSSRTDTRCTRSPRCPCGSAVPSSLASIFFPEEFPSPETMWRVTTAFGDDATPSNDGPHRPLPRLHSCCAGGMLRCDVRLWPHGPTATAVSQARRWTEKNRPSPPAGCLGRGRVARRTVPRRLVAAAASAPPHVASPRRPPAALGSRRARRAASRRPLQAPHSTPRRVARKASGDGPARWTPTALSPGHVSTYGPAPPA